MLEKFRPHSWRQSCFTKRSYSLKTVNEGVAGIGGVGGRSSGLTTLRFNGWYRGLQLQRHQVVLAGEVAVGLSFTGIKECQVEP